MRNPALVTALVLAACSTSEPIQITIHSQSGSDHHELTRDELAAAVAAPVPAYHVDGIVTTDPSRLLTGTQLELPLPDDAGTLVATRVDNTLYADGLEVTWNTDRTSLQVTTAAGAIAIDIAGVDAGRDRDRLAGRLIETFVGADTGSSVLADGKADGGVTIAIIVAVSYIACVTGGNAVCGNVASDTCASTGVDEYKMICGAGFDVEGSFKLGMTCSFRCK